MPAAKASPPTTTAPAAAAQSGTEGGACVAGPGVAVVLVEAMLVMACASGSLRGVASARGSGGLQ